MKHPAVSIRARLALWHAGVLALVVCVFSVGVPLFVRARLYRALDGQLDADLATIERVYREETGDLGELAHRLGVVSFEVVEGPTVIYRTAGWPPGGGVPYRVRTTADAVHRITAARDERPVHETLATLGLILAVGAPVAMALALAGGYVLAERVLAPVGAMAEAARQITAESLSARLTVGDPRDEFGRLATVFNDTLQRLQHAFEQLRRFTADASHELRTPLTAMRSVGEVALQRPLGAEGYREVIGSMLEEVDRLTRLVENLLTLTRAEAGRIPLTLDVVDLAALAGSAAESLRVLADDKGPILDVETAGPVPVRCDGAILRQALLSLLHNAIKYTPCQGTIRVTAGATAGEASLAVTDGGPGIAAEHRERIFERFYRVDEGRARDAGGVGLGLAIARWAVEANGGRIEVESAEGRGSVFRILLPKGS
jgi:heavy metal sensor kinase